MNVSGGVLMPEQAAFDVTRYDIRLRIDPDARTINGAVIVDAKIVQPINAFVLDLDPALSVKAVSALDAKSAGTALRYDRREGRIWAWFNRTQQPGESVRVKVDYGGTPRVAPRPPWDGGFTWAKTSTGDHWIATTCQMNGADLWWPCKDHPSDRADSVDLQITVPQPLICAANGKLTATRKNADGTTTYSWHVSTPINNYAVALNIAPYKTVEATYTSTAGQKVPVTFWALPQDHEKAAKLVPEFLKMIRFFEMKCGPYPFRKDKIGVAQTPHLGMEHQTITAYGDRFRNNEYGFDWLLFHEFAHEWFANLVTNLDWKDMWIHEGFATYLEALYAEELKGDDGYRRYMARLRMSCANRRPVAAREALDSRQAYVDSDIYMKGACILGTLRYLIGDKPFFEALRRMAYPDPKMEAVIDGGQCRYATTDDFLRIAEAASGKKLDWFFEVYLRQPALPRLVTEQTGDGVRLRWDVPDGLAFPMPVEVKIGTATRRVEVPAEGVVIPAANGSMPVIDPRGLLLRAR